MTEAKKEFNEEQWNDRFFICDRFNARLRVSLCLSNQESAAHHFCREECLQKIEVDKQNVGVTWSLAEVASSRGQAPPEEAPPNSPKETQGARKKAIEATLVAAGPLTPSASLRSSAMIPRLVSEPVSRSTQNTAPPWW